ncbi:MULTISPECIES: sigma factor [unclassified Mesorhizobium]|uniref:sigma factor n=1 Tax=unclassified Mesorhizobium TaxID=325217 RepID=UPI001FDF345C|nr:MULTISPECIES: sigma factor [unclassified Mesorhizobium]
MPSTPLSKLITSRLPLYRIARGLLCSDAEAEDILQEAYVRALAHLSAFHRRRLPVGLVAHSHQ